MTRSSASSNRRQGEQGSALLIVFVFAAIIGIMLYRELPISVFEAQRQKEQSLVDRGHEYVRAVQLFYRRNHGQYPASMDQLESSNNIRYLRRRYKDPFTGEDDWRLLHAGPGGVLIDSKLNRTGLPGAPNTTSAQAGGSAINGSGLNGSTLNGTASSVPGSTSSANNKGSSASLSWNEAIAAEAEAATTPARQRPPAIPANGSGTAFGQTPGTAELNATPDTPLLPPSTDAATPSSGVPVAANASGAAPVQPGAGASLQGTNGTSPQRPNIMQTLSPLLANPTTPPTTNSAATAAGGGTQSNASGLGTMGQMNGGGALAGVASKAKGHGIKIINDQDDYSLWEFYYDPSTDKSMSAAPTQTGMNAATASPSTTTNSTAFGSSPQTTAATGNSSTQSATDPAAISTAGTTATLPPQQ